MIKKLLFTSALLLGLAAKADFQYETYTFIGSGTASHNYSDFSWTWRDYTAPRINTTWSIANMTNILLALSSQQNNRKYLLVYGGTQTASSPVSSFTMTLANSNIPPNGIYYADFMTAVITTNGSNVVYSPSRILASGKIQTLWSAWSPSNSAAWSNSNNALVFNEMDPLAVKTATLGEPVSTGAVSITGNNLNIQFPAGSGSGSTSTLYSVASSVSGLGFTTGNGPQATLTGIVATANTEVINSNGMLVTISGTNRYLTVTNTPLFGGQPPSAFATASDLNLASNANAAAAAAANTNASARLSSNVWAAADSTTNYVSRLGGSYKAGAGASWTLFSNSGDELFALDDSGILMATDNNTTPVILSIGQLNDGVIETISGYFSGDGSHWSNVNATNSTSLNSISATNYARGGVLNGTTNRPDSNGLLQFGTISGGGSLANQRSFEWRDAEGSLNVGWTKQLAAGVNLISVRTATNDLTFAAYATTASTTLQTNTLYAVFAQPMTGAIPWVVRSSQAVTGGLVIFTPKDGQTAGAAITQALAAASTTYVTNQPLTITAKTATVEVRIATTNAANLFQLGVDVQ